MLKASHMLFTDNTFLGEQEIVFAEKKEPINYIWTVSLQSKG